ncbi:MAG TPA: hypothetical protein VFF67_04490 [Thermoplasmata archaeon]|nr:hypothetical protein [Thermoplasmata archaeon]
MSYASPGSAATVRRTLPHLRLIVLLVAVAAALPVGLFVAGGPSRPHAATPSVGIRAEAISVPAPALAPRPSLAGVNGTFFQNTSSFSQVPSTSQICNGPATFLWCYAESQSPSLVNLTNGHLGIGFSEITGYNTSGCAFANQTASRVLFANSSNQGVSFGTPLYISSPCPYEQQFDPAFALGGHGVVDGVFVEANVSLGRFAPYISTPRLSLAQPYGNILAFTNSTTNGSSFATAKGLVFGNVSRPAIATFGNTIYVVYENLTNTSAVLPGTYSGDPVSVNLVYSADQGTTWHGPYLLPGLNATENHTSYSPSITLLAGGKIAVAYATNRACLLRTGFCTGVYGESIVVDESSGNGTTWLGLHTVAPMALEPGLGSYSYYQGGYLQYLWEYAPTTAIAYDPTSGNLYVAYTGALNAGATSYAFYNYTQSSVFTAASTNGGTTWSSRLASLSESFYQQYPLGGGSYNPSLAVHAGTVFLAYTYFNDTYQTCGLPSVLAHSYSEWLAHSADGLNWSSPWNLAMSINGAGYWTYDGWTSSIAFSATGAPIAAYALTLQSTYPNYVQRETLQVATVWSGTTVPVTFRESGLAPLTSWGFAVGGNFFTTTAASVTVLDVPNGAAVMVNGSGKATVVAYETIFTTLTSPEMTSFTAPGNFTFQYGTLVGWSLSLQPYDVPNFYLSFYNTSGTGINWYLSWYTYLNGGTHYTSSYGCPFPWFLPKGTTITLGPNLYTPPFVTTYYAYGSTVSYWNGTGNGNFTGSGPTAQFTMNSPINETAWALPVGEYNVSFSASGLKPTSTYSFQFNQKSFSAPATSSVTAANVTTGPHWVTAIAATSSAASWQYFGTPATGNPVDVPTQTQVLLNFSYVNMGSPAGVVHFHANAFPSGTVWRFAFNGTVYSSSTPWINITTRSGVFSTAAYSATASNASVGYAPTGVPARWNVTAGSTYLVNFTNAYHLAVYPGSGGTVSPSTTSYWLAPGTVVWLNATPASGYRFTGWAGLGSGSYTGTNFTAKVTANGPISESATFAALPGARFNLTFVQSGLPVGTLWTVYLNGVGYSSTAANLTVPHVYSCVVSGASGTYALTVPYTQMNSGTNVTRFVPTSPPATACGGTTVSLAYTPQYLLTIEAGNGGSVSAAVGRSLTTNGTYVPSGAAAVIQATASTGYQFLGWTGTGAGSYTGTTTPQTIYPGGPVTEVAAFALIPPTPNPKYTVTFTETPAFPAGTPWEVVLNATVYTSTGSTLNATGVGVGSYSLSVPTATSADGLTEWKATNAPGKVSVPGTLAVALTFAASFYVKIVAVGPGSVTGASGWYADGAPLTITATPTPPDVFAGWSGTGTNAYTGTSAAPPTITVKGPLTEVATFVPPAPAAQATSSVFGSTSLLLGLALVGAVVGLVVGLLVARMRRGGGPPSGDETPPAEAPTPGDVPMPDDGMPSVPEPDDTGPAPPDWSEGDAPEGGGA